MVLLKSHDVWLCNALHLHHGDESEVNTAESYDPKAGCIIGTARAVSSARVASPTCIGLHTPAMQNAPLVQAVRYRSIMQPALDGGVAEGADF